MKIHNLIIFCATLALTTAVYADENKALTVNQKPVIAAPTISVEKVVTKKAKHSAKQNQEEEAALLNLDAVNKATESDLKQAVGKKAANRIVTARTKKGRFTDVKDFCKVAKIRKGTLKKLAKAFPNKEAITK